MMVFCGIILVMTFVPSLMICCFVAGNLHLKVGAFLEMLFQFQNDQTLFQIQKAYQPMTNLLANQQLKFSTTIRIVRILDLINSEHSGEHSF